MLTQSCFRVSNKLPLIFSYSYQQDTPRHLNSIVNDESAYALNIAYYYIKILVTKIFHWLLITLPPIAYKISVYAKNVKKKNYGKKIEKI